MFSTDDRTDMMLVTHYFSGFNCLLLLLNHILLREVFFCQNLTFIKLTLTAVRYDSFINCILGCIFTWSGW
jgi:hypothetical protein